jgi:hypothetical protein
LALQHQGLDKWVAPAIRCQNLQYWSALQAKVGELDVNVWGTQSAFSRSTLHVRPRLKSVDIIRKKRESKRNHDSDQIWQSSRIYQRIHQELEHGWAIYFQRIRTKKLSRLNFELKSFC